MSDLSDRLETPTVMVRVTWMATALVEAGDSNVLSQTPEEYAESLAAGSFPSDGRLTQPEVIGARAERVAGSAR